MTSFVRHGVRYACWLITTLHEARQ